MEGGRFGGILLCAFLKNLCTPLVFIQLCGVINYQKQCDFQIVSLILFGYRFFEDSIDEAEKGGQIPRKTARKDLNSLIIMLI